MENFKIACAQYPIDSFQNSIGWKEKLEKWIQEAVGNKAEVLVFPEYGSLELTSLFEESVQKDLRAQIRCMDDLKDSFIQTFVEFSKKYKVHILAPSLPVWNDSKKAVNRAFFFGPTGEFGFQDKQYMTRFEDEEWGITAGDPILKIFDTKFGKMAVLICFDSEFALDAMEFVQNGVEVLLIPSCTETMWGLTRVHVGSRARALENQLVCAVSHTVGDAPWSLAVDKNVGQAAFFAPSDLGYPEDGILAMGELNKAQWVYGDVDGEKIKKVREFGAVFNYKFNQQRKVNFKKIEHVRLS